MAQIQKQAVKERIYEAALDIFYEKGYKDATMREIAEKAEIPVGLIYTYYKNKAELLESIVEPIFDFLAAHMKPSNGRDKDLDICFEEERQMLLKLMYSRKAMVIAMDRCAGTKYENTKERAIKMVEAHIATERRLIVDDFEEFHATILATCFVEAVMAIARHYESREWAERMILFITDQLFPVH